MTEDMQSCEVLRQMPVQAGRVERRHGEAGPETACDETATTLHEYPHAGSAKSKEGTGGLLEAALTRQNLQTAWKWVKANKGAAGVDGLDIEQTAQVIRQNWPDIRQALLAGRYRPSPVRKVRIPGPLSPMLANVLLDEVDKVLEARGYSCAVASAFGRKFLDYSLWVAKGKKVKCKLAEQPLSNVNARIKQITRRSGGRSVEQVVQKLRPYVLGWKAYFGLAQTPRVWLGLDEWLRHRLRAIQLKQWKRPKTMYRELKVLGATEALARQLAGNCHSWWRHSDRLLKTVMTIAYFDRLGVPRRS